jgi:CheY-specific phosphatase CheX
MTTPKTASKREFVVPRSQWWVALRDATLEVLSPMFGTAVAIPLPSNDPAIVLERADSQVTKEVTKYVTGMVGIAGPVRAILSLRCSERAATKIASHMLGISSDEAAGQKTDAIGEICNMVASHFKNNIGFGDDCILSAPTVVAGGKCSVHCLEAGHGLEFPAIYEDETVMVTLDIRARRNAREP